jgi:secondary thiamine-phosphate synthase enzyme
MAKQTDGSLSWIVRETAGAPCVLGEMNMWLQKRIVLGARPRGFHVITDELVRQLPELAGIEAGLAHFFIQHTSASLVINENADPAVRRDLERYFNHSVPQGAAYFTHTQEGPDDMPAHVKSCLLGSSVTVPVAHGRLLLGVWQGIYLGEHRDRAGGRTVIATLNGKG